MHTKYKIKNRKKRLDPVPVNSLIKASRLQAIVEQAQLISFANEYLSALLPEHIQSQCNVANIRNDNMLILHVSNSSIATQLHYQQHSLLNQLQSHPYFAHIKNISIKVKPLSAK